MTFCVAQGSFTVFNDQGAYKCAACELLLYTSDHKFSKQDSVHGWAAFFDNVPGALPASRLLYALVLVGLVISLTFCFLVWFTGMETCHPPPIPALNHLVFPN